MSVLDRLASWAGFVRKVASPLTTLELGLLKIPPQVLHAVMGATCESVEALDALKKTLYKNQPLDWVNLDEEIGDQLHYIQQYINYRAEMLGLDLTFIDFIDKNESKLSRRYKDGFTTEEAINRDLGQEREVLESKFDARQAD